MRTASLLVCLLAMVLLTACGSSSDGPKGADSGTGGTAVGDSGGSGGVGGQSEADGAGGNAGAPSDSGGQGDAKTSVFMITLVVDSGDLDPSEAQVSVRKGTIGQWEPWGKVSEYKGKPYKVDTAEPGFDGAGIKIDPPAGTLAAPRQIGKAEFVPNPNSPVNQVIAHLPVGRDISGAPWSCEKKELKDGLPTGQKWNTSGSINMEAKWGKSSHFFCSGAGLDISFELVGSFISFEDASWGGSGNVTNGAKTINMTATSKATPSLKNLYYCTRS